MQQAHLLIEPTVSRRAFNSLLRCNDAIEKYGDDEESFNSLLRCNRCTVLAAKILAESTFNSLLRCNFS